MLYFRMIGQERQNMKHCRFFEKHKKKHFAFKDFAFKDLNNNMQNVSFYFILNKDENNRGPTSSVMPWARA